MESEIAIWGLTSLTDFYKWVHLLLNKQHVSSETYIFSSWQHQKLLLIANKLQDSTFFFEINRKEIAISKLKSQLKLLQSS